MLSRKIHFGCLVFFTFLLVQCHNHGPEDYNGAYLSKSISTPSIETKAKASITEIKKEEKTIKEIEKSADIISTPVKTEIATTATTIKKEAKNIVEEKAKPTLTSIKESVEEKKEIVKVKKEKVTKESTKVIKKAKKKTKKRAKIKFEKTSHPFGTIKQGDIVKYNFKFTNTGNAPLVIKQVDVSCGCTFPSYPFIPIEPGKEGVIGVQFDSKGKIGVQKPKIKVVTNGQPRTLQLNLEGIVE